MHLEKNSLFLGYPTFLIRKVFRHIGQFDVTSQFFSYHMKIKKAEAHKLVNQLIQDGYLERKPFKGQHEYVTRTIKGNSLAMASFAKPITRQTADKKIAELIERAKTVNISEKYLYKVRRISVFGSYLTDKEQINDIDVDIILEGKYSKEIQLKKEDACIKKAIHEGKRFGSFIDRLFYPQYLTRKYLKQRSRALSLHYGDGILKDVESRVIFELNDE